MKLLQLDHIEQTTDYTCGPATVLSFLKYHDKKFSLKLTERKLSSHLKTCARIGTKPKNIITYIKQFNSNFKINKNLSLIDLEKSLEKELPSIVLWYDDTEWHWSTYVGHANDKIILMDPLSQNGLRSIDKSQFKKSWAKLAIK
jgi:ABC-type bacteriocin/lantibiotic exporter with double-glycine peptidase domain